MPGWDDTIFNGLTAKPRRRKGLPADPGEDHDFRSRFMREVRFEQQEGPLPPRPKDRDDWWTGKGGPSINQGGQQQPWTPASLPNLVAWYDAQAASTIILNGSTVSQWNDKSGHGYNAVQGTAASQPTHGATSFNGKPGLTFNGSSNAIVAAAPAGLFPNAFAWYGAIAPQSSAANISPFDRGLNNLPAPFYLSGSSVFIGNGSTYTLDPGPTSYRLLTVGAPVVFGGLYTKSGDAYTEWSNGTQSYLNAAEGAAANYGDNATTINLGSRPDSGGYYSGVTGEMVLAGALATADRQKLEGYMAWRWGLQGLLPAGHPYKAGPP